MTERDDAERDWTPVPLEACDTRPTPPIQPVEDTNGEQVWVLEAIPETELLELRLWAPVAAPLPPKESTHKRWRRKKEAAGGLAPSKAAATEPLQEEPDFFDPGRSKFAEVLAKLQSVTNSQGKQQRSKVKGSSKANASYRK